jgi:RNA polymerase sigma-70 factor (ECF subfamily)
MSRRPADDARDRVARLYDQHGASLYRYALMLLADPAVAEDAVQQVFSSLLQRSAASRGIENEAHYLRRAVRNECYSMLRRGLRRHPVYGSGALLEPAAGGETYPEERIALERALQQLPPDQREVVHLHVYEGLTLQEVADVTGVSINTVASRYRYALDKLREALRRT